MGRYICHWNSSGFLDGVVGFIKCVKTDVSRFYYHLGHLLFNSYFQVIVWPTYRQLISEWIFASVIILENSYTGFMFLSIHQFVVKVRLLGYLDPRDTF